MLATLIIKAQADNQDAMLRLIARFQPLLRKRARLLNYEDSYNDLVLLFIETIRNINLEKIEYRGDGAIVNYIAKSIYHSYCKLVGEAVAQRATSCSLEAISSRQLYISAAYHGLTHQILDFPRGLLSQREEQILKLVYEKDLSISEIAKICHISRQAVNQAKLRAESKLKAYYSAYR